MPVFRGKSLLTVSIIFLRQITKCKIVATKGVNKFKALTHVAQVPYRYIYQFPSFKPIFLSFIFIKSFSASYHHLLYSSTFSPITFTGLCLAFVYSLHI